MSPTTTHERIVWRAPRALAGAGSTPALLGFATDDFMARLEAALDADPPAIDGLTARPEHWSDTQPPPFSVPARPSPAPTDGLKLFQPAHGRFYLIAAQLACRRYGYPDRRLSRTESVGFVVRRVEPTSAAPVEVSNPSTFTELAWVPEGTGGRWEPVTTRHAPVAGEELLPLVPTVHQVGDRRSRLLTGLIPVGARERYEARDQLVAAATTTVTTDLLANPLEELLDVSVIAAFRQLAGFQTLPTVRRPGLDEQMEMFSLALVDLVDLVERVIGDTLATVAADHLRVLARDLATDVDWDQIVVLAAASREELLDGDELPAPLEGHVAAVQSLRFDTLIGGLEAYRGSLPEPPTPPATTPQPDPTGGLRYVARCVYRRADCAHERPEWMSPPTEPFRFASFFDPDAPGRPIQISLPIDTSPSGLRQFPRNVKVLLSKQLRAQMDQVKGLDDIGAKVPFDLGMLCSLSIPIITICALILLMVVVSILNIVFMWLPFFKICLPVPEGEE